MDTKQLEKNKSQNINWKNVLKWIAVFPSSLIVFVFIYLSIQVWLGIGKGEYWLKDYLGPLIAGLGAGYCYIWTGVKIAPAYKINTALTLLIVMTLSGGASLYLQIQSKQYSRIIIDIASIIGMILAYKEIIKRNKTENL